MKKKDDAIIKIIYNKDGNGKHEVKIDMNYNCENWELIYLLCSALIKVCQEKKYPFKKCYSSLKKLEKEMRKSDK